MSDNYSKWQTQEGIKNLPEFDGDTTSSRRGRPRSGPSRAGGRRAAPRPSPGGSGSARSASASRFWSAAMPGAVAGGPQGRPVGLGLVAARDQPFSTGVSSAAATSRPATHERRGRAGRAQLETAAAGGRSAHGDQPPRRAGGSARTSTQALQRVVAMRCGRARAPGGRASGRRRVPNARCLVEREPLGGPDAVDDRRSPRSSARTRPRRRPSRDAPPRDARRFAGAPSRPGLRSGRVETKSGSMTSGWIDRRTTATARPGREPAASQGSRDRRRRRQATTT